MPKKKNLSRFLSFLLAFCMVVSLLPTMAFAATVTTDPTTWPAPDTQYTAPGKNPMYLYLDYSNDDPDLHGVRCRHNCTTGAQLIDEFVKATATTAGYAKYTCSACGSWAQIDVPALPVTAFKLNSAYQSMIDNGIEFTGTSHTVVYDILPAYQRFVGTALTNEFNATDVGTHRLRITVSSDIYDTTVYAIWKDAPSESWTITYDANGGTGTMSDSTVSDGEMYVLPGCGFAAPEGKVFDCWAIGSISGERVPAGGSYTFTEDTTVYAIWKDLPPVSYGITGIVLQNGTGVPGATVQLKQGAQVIAQQVTGADGSFAFSSVPVGVYNLVAEKDGITMTVKQEIVSSNANLTITLPAGMTNSVVDIEGEDTPPVIVGALETVFEDEAIYTPEDQKIVENGGAVEIKLAVEKQDAPPAADQIEAIKPAGQTIGLYLNLTIIKTVTPKNGKSESHIIKQVGSLIETLVPLPEEMQGKDNYTVYREHEGVAEALPNSGNGERYEVNSTKTSITIFAQKYSTYAIAWSDNSETPPTPPDPPVPPVPPVYPSYPSGGSSTVSTYAITVERTEHGTVTSSHKNASSGTTVTLTVTPDAGYVLSTLTATDSRGNEVTLNNRDNGKYTFTMPARAVAVTATFAPLPEDVEQPCDGGADCPSRKFLDLGTVGTWYHEAVDYVLRNGLMNGHGDGTFEPNGNLSRAQLAQILFNLEGKPVVNYLLQFTDVPGGAWYTEAVRWATSMGIINGYGNGLFGPDDNITREQLAVMLWRYAGSPAATEKELHFSDAGQASGWSLEALRWAVENGILSGKGNGVLDPAGLATRAEAAEMLKNFSENQ